MENIKTTKKVMDNSKILKARQFKKNEALNAIREIYNPNYKSPYSQANMYGDWDDLPSPEEDRENRIRYIIEQLEKDLSKLKVINH